MNLEFYYEVGVQKVERNEEKIKNLEILIEDIDSKIRKLNLQRDLYLQAIQGHKKHIENFSRVTDDNE
jgi:hypothetical protein